MEISDATSVGESGIFPQWSPYCLLRALGRAGLSLRLELCPPALAVDGASSLHKFPGGGRLPATLAFSPAACLIAEPLLLG